MTRSAAVSPLLAAVAALLGGCSLPLGWDDVPTAIVTPSATSYADWETEVNAAIEAWNAPLVARGCPTPFALGEGGHRVTLVEPAAWAHGLKSGWTEGDGLRSRGFIEIRDRGGADQISDHIGDLTHELGHALGLGHSDNTLGSSIMGNPINGDRVFARDLDAAACVLGCGGCELADHFDRE